VDYTVKIAIAFGLHKPFGYINPSGSHSSGAYKGKTRVNVGPSKLNFPGVSEAEYSSALGPSFRSTVAAGAFGLVLADVPRDAPQWHLW
jgi:hypothetical protein